MTESNTPVPGTVSFFDLTVPDAEAVRDFYEAVVGWRHEPEDMGEYDDYHMVAADGRPVTGIVHARGMNADNPRQWLIYITVADLDASMEACARLGGRVIVGPTDLGSWGRTCVIEDPAGAVAALIQPPG